MLLYADPSEDWKTLTLVGTGITVSADTPMECVDKMQEAAYIYCAYHGIPEQNIETKKLRLGIQVHEELLRHRFDEIQKSIKKEKRKKRVK